TLPSEQIVTLPVAQWSEQRLDLRKRPAIFLLLAR
ncbi:MAG TPA: SAM-dependent methyltransferase, partial [Burkholderiaceae bacterium]|nr:SAM-dependent methyltransferase [Burkholderiaceae bacterium]